MKKNGFTLIELMIVIAIIALLAAVALPKFAGVTDDAKAAQVRSDLSVLRTSLSMYNAKFGAFPACGTAGVTVPIGANGNLDNITDLAAPANGLTNPVTVATAHNFTTILSSTAEPGFYQKYRMPTIPVGTSVTTASIAVTDGGTYDANLGGWWYNDSTGEIHAQIATTAYNAGINWRVE